MAAGFRDGLPLGRTWITHRQVSWFEYFVIVISVMDFNLEARCVKELKVWFIGTG